MPPFEHPGASTSDDHRSSSMDTRGSRTGFSSIAGVILELYFWSFLGTEAWINIYVWARFQATFCIDFESKLTRWGF